VSNNTLLSLLSIHLHPIRLIAPSRTCYSYPFPHHSTIHSPPSTFSCPLETHHSAAHSPPSFGFPYSLTPSKNSSLHYSLTTLLSLLSIHSHPLRCIASSKTRHSYPFPHHSTIHSSHSFCSSPYTCIL